MKLFGLFFFLLLLFSCSSENQAGGSGMDIPNSIGGTIVNAQGDFVPNARVRLVKKHDWLSAYSKGESVVLAETTSDDAGEFGFQVELDTLVNIEVMAENLSLLVALDTAQKTFTLSENSLLQSRWLPHSEVAIVGSSLRAEVNEEGAVLMKQVPQGFHSFVGRSKNAKVQLLNSFHLVSDSILSPDSLETLKDSICIGAFETAHFFTALDPWVGGSIWYSLSDGDDEGDSQIIPSTAGGEFLKAGLVEGHQGQGLRVDYSISATDAEAYGILGVTFGRGLDLNALDSVSFWVKTDGDFLLSVEDKDAASLKKTEEWTRVVVDQAEFRAAEVEEQMINLQFVFKDRQGSFFILDEVCLYGDLLEMVE